MASSCFYKRKTSRLFFPVIAVWLAKPVQLSSRAFCTQCTFKEYLKILEGKASCLNLKPNACNNTCNSCWTAWINFLSMTIGQTLSRTDLLTPFYENDMLSSFKDLLLLFVYTSTIFCKRKIDSCIYLILARWEKTTSITTDTVITA